jgi:hypothetical protein
MLFAIFLNNLFNNYIKVQTGGIIEIIHQQKILTYLFLNF